MTACNDQFSAGQQGALAGLPTFTSTLAAGVHVHKSASAVIDLSQVHNMHDEGVNLSC